IAVRLARAGNVTVVRECRSGREAVKAIRQLSPDLVFLDVQMPGLDGFGVIEEIGVENMPPVVFVTAYDAHAVRAFEAEAIDYLLKPIDDERFTRMLERAKRRVNERNQSAVGQRFTALIAQLRAGGHTTPAPVREGARILIREGGRVVFVEPADIDWIAAEGDYVRVHTARRSHLLRETMSAMEQRFDPARFVRIHRSTLVNLARVAELRPITGREWEVALHDGTRLRLSRRYRDRLGAQIGGRL
ncbi:MAG: LytR/AlgR family response regulator transcription factor, partial [Gemmatimonadaceae bacterium]